MMLYMCHIATRQPRIQFVPKQQTSSLPDKTEAIHNYKYARLFARL